MICPIYALLTCQLSRTRCIIILCSSVFFTAGKHMEVAIVCNQRCGKFRSHVLNLHSSHILDHIRHYCLLPCCTGVIYQLCVFNAGKESTKKAYSQFSGIKSLDFDRLQCPVQLGALLCISMLNKVNWSVGEGGLILSTILN